MPPEHILDVTRRKLGHHPKPSMTGGTPAHKQKKTTPTCWLPHTQPQKTYAMGDKELPTWGLIHKGIDPTEDNQNLLRT